MPDYRKLLDEQVWAYIARTEKFYPPDAVDLSVADQRAVYDVMCADFHRGRPEGVRTWDETHGGVASRRYEAGPSEVTVVFYHGGGWVVGSLDSHDDVCAEICARTGYRVVAVDYALAPEHPFPRCFEDAWAAYGAISDAWPEPVVLVGDSAGGNLAAAVSHFARGRRTGPVGQVLIYPSLGHEWSKEPYGPHADAPQLTVRDLDFYVRTRAGGPLPYGDARFAPQEDGDFSGLPPTVLITAECDPLASDGEAYRDAVRAAGGKAAWINERGLVHGYLRARSMSDRAQQSFDRIVSAVAALGQDDWPAVRS